MFCLWVCFVWLFDVIKEQTIAIRHLLGCHSLDGASLFSKVHSNKLRINVKNKMTLIDTKFDADFINISEVTKRKTKWPRFFWPTLYIYYSADVEYNSTSTSLGVSLLLLLVLLAFVYTSLFSRDH